MISQVTMGLDNKLDLSNLAAGVSPYPSYTDGVKNLTDQFNKTKLTPFTKTLLRKVIEFRR